MLGNSSFTSQIVYTIFVHTGVRFKLKALLVVLIQSTRIQVDIVQHYTMRRRSGVSKFTYMNTVTDQVMKYGDVEVQRNLCNGNNTIICAS